MTEAVQQGVERGEERGPAEKLVALYASGMDEGVREAEQLTLGMISETAEWLRRPGAQKGAEVVRAWWLRQVDEYAGGEVAQEFRDRWDEAFKKKAAKSKPEVSKEALEGALKALPKPKLEGDGQPKPEPPFGKGGKALAEATRARLDPPVSWFQYSRTPRGIPASLENAMIAIKAMKLECRYDEFHDRVFVKGYENSADGDVLENLENTLTKLRERVLREYGFDPGKEFLADALRGECLDHVFDPVRDYLDGLKWDGKPRIDTWLIRYCRAKNTPLIRAFGRKFLLAGVRRVRKPGRKFDYVLTLEGAQGIGKSSLFRILAGEDNFCDNEIIGLDKREVQEAIQGVWIYELGELEGMRKAEATHIKLFLSKTHDKARPAWGRV